jgi:hypothetical protein
MPTPSAAKHSCSPTDGVIEITQEMIEAGARQLLLFEPTDTDLAAYSTFKAMIGASPVFRNYQVVEPGESLDQGE